MSENMLEEQDFSIEAEGPNMCGRCWNTNLRTGDYVQKQAYPTIETKDGFEQITNPIESDKLSPDDIFGWECADCFAATQATSYNDVTTTHPLANLADLADEVGVDVPPWEKFVNNNKTHAKKWAYKDPAKTAWEELVDIPMI